MAQVCPRYTPYVGGIETHVKEISERLKNKGFYIEILTSDPSGNLLKEEVINGIDVKRFKSWAPNEAYYFSKDLKRHLKKISSSFDIVHVHSYHALPALYASQTKKNNLLFFTPHYLGKGQTFFRNLLHIPYKFIAKKIFKESDKVICVSKYEKNMIIKNFQIGEEKISIIPNGVNVDELSKFNWAPNLKNPKIVYSGRLEKSQKNVDKLIRSFKKLVENTIDAQFVIIGDGPYKIGMKNLIKKLDLEERVKVKNWLPRIEYLKELASSNVFVLPSDYECYGIAAAEAIIMGIPTVVADSTALSEFVENGLAFGINTPITPHEIAKSIQKALTTPKVAITSTQDKILSWDNIVERLEKLYLEISSSKKNLTGHLNS